MNGVSVRKLDFVRCVCVPLIASCLAPISSAAPPEAQDIPAAAREAKKTVRVATDEELARAKQEVLAAKRSLGRWLARAPKRGDAWKTYLRWNQMDEELAAEKPQVGRLRAIVRRMRRDHVGLETPRFVRLRHALRRYNDTLAFRNNRRAAEAAAQWLEILAEATAKHREKPSDETARRLNRVVRLLSRTNQAPAVIEAVRRAYSHPNLFVHVSRDVVAAGIEQEIPADQRNIKINENILGTQVYGDGKTTGAVKMRLIPNRDRAVFETHLVGRTISDNVGYNGPVTIYSSGLTKFAARKRIFLDGDGMRSDPATAQATTETDIHDIYSRRRFGSKMILRVAWKRASGSKHQTQRIAGRRAEARVNQRVDKQAAELVAKANERYRKEFRAPLVRQDALPERIAFSTTEDHLLVEAKQAGHHGLGAPGAAPKLDSKHGIEIRVHESMVNNFATAIMAGRRVTRSQMIADLEKSEFSPETAERLKKERDDDTKEGLKDWFIVYADNDPITVRLADDHATVTIRGQEFGRVAAAVTTKADMEITATYKFELGDQGLRLVRQGDVKVEPAGGKPPTAAERTLQGRLTKRFGAFLEPEIKAKPLTLPGQWEKAGKFRAKLVRAADGWLSVGLDAE